MAEAGMRNSVERTALTGRKMRISRLSGVTVSWVGTAAVVSLACYPSEGGIVIGGRADSVDIETTESGVVGSCPPNVVDINEVTDKLQCVLGHNAPKYAAFHPDVVEA